MIPHEQTPKLKRHFTCSTAVCKKTAPAGGRLFRCMIEPSSTRDLMKLSHNLLKSIPKVLLHEHLDGVLRPQTVIELARANGYLELPTDSPQALADWFHHGANKGSLPEYLRGFRHTIAVLQTAEALERVAYEQAEDLNRDGVIYFETRFAPIFHTRNGLTHQQVIAAVLKGLERGRQDFGIRAGLIICAMRNMNVSLEMAELAVDFRERGVVGFDLAGEEGGYPPKKHVDAFHFIQRENFNITVHAGEGYGKESIWQAIQYCGAHRIGHATRLIDDITIADGNVVKLGDLAQYVLDKRVPLEICLLSNVHTGATPSLAEHPFRVFYDQKFRVFLNTDNRLMSNTTLTGEFEVAAETFDLSLDDFEKLTINAMKSAFLPYDERCRFIYEVLKPGYATARQQLKTEAGVATH
jgi:adenosine deaminase